MKKITKHILIIFALYGMSFLSGCGNDGGAIRTEINGVFYEARILSANCFALNSFAVEPVSDLECTVSFASRTGYADSLHFRVNNIQPIYNSGIGVWLPIFAAPFQDVSVTLQGQIQIIDGGSIRFNRISNYPGEDICADIEWVTRYGQIDGYFCAPVQGGY